MFLISCVYVGGGGGGGESNNNWDFTDFWPLPLKLGGIADFDISLDMIEQWIHYGVVWIIVGRHLYE